MKKMIPVVIVMCFILCSCGTKKEAVHKEESYDVDNNIITKYADVTQDGIPDEIRINMYALEDINDENCNVDTVEIFSGKTNEKIWGKRIDFVHMNQDGIYIYNDGEKDYILELDLYMCLGDATYRYNILNLSENGDETVNYTEDVQFSVNEDKKESDDADNVQKFETNVNKYLEKSYVILDTNYAEPKSADSDEITGIYYSTANEKKAVLCDLKDVTNSNSQPIAVPVS